MSHGCFFFFYGWLFCRIFTFFKALFLSYINCHTVGHLMKFHPEMIWGDRARIAFFWKFSFLDNTLLACFWGQNQHTITLSFRGLTSVVMSSQESDKDIHTHHIYCKRGFNIPIFIIHWHSKYTASCHILIQQPAFCTHVESSCHCLHPNVLLLINHKIDALLHCSQRSNANVSSLRGIENLRLHPVLAAVKIAVPLFHSVGTLPSGGRS